MVVVYTPLRESSTAGSGDGVAVGGALVGFSVGVGGGGGWVAVGSSVGVGAGRVGLGSGASVCGADPTAGSVAAFDSAEGIAACPEAQAVANKRMLIKHRVIFIAVSPYSCHSR